MEHRNLSQQISPGLKQAQRLVMSPKMQQALAVLQMPITELTDKVTAELERNPLLSTEELEGEGQTDIQMEALLNETEGAPTEEDTQVDHSLSFKDEDYEVFRRLDQEFRDHFFEGGSVWRRTSDEEYNKNAYDEGQVVEEATLFESLMRQAHETFETKQQLAMAEAIIGSLDDNGFLTTPLGEIAAWGSFDLEALKPVLASIQTFSPSGVGGADVREALLIQLQHLDKWESLAYRIVDQCYDDLMHGRMAGIANHLGVSYTDVKQAVENDLSRLTLFPGHLHVREYEQPLVADLVITEDGDQLRYEVSVGDMPTLRLNRLYLNMLEDPEQPQETRAYLMRRLSSARWLIHNLDRRQRTLEHIAAVLIRWQEGYLRSIEGKLRPMTMRVLAEEIGVNESTIARAVAGKYLSCPRGMMTIRSLFSGAYETDEGKQVSTTAVRDIVERLIDAEDKAYPLTDQQISEELATRGISCARRTVAKYRGQLGYGTAARRRSR